jgi:hypothetical protein
MREKSVLFKEAVDCCDYTSSTVDEEMGAEHEVKLLEKKNRSSRRKHIPE